MAERTKVSAILAREFAQMQWVDPERVLVNLRRLELRLPVDMNHRMRRLRTNQLKVWREAREAAIFAFGVSTQVLKIPVRVTRTEHSDFDFVIRWESDNGYEYFPVQLKELPPSDVNPHATLDQLYDKLGKYSGAEDLSVVISLNRRGQFPLVPWNRPKRPSIRELWYLGCEAPDQSAWFIYGSVLESNPKKYSFLYPQAVSDGA